MGIDKEDECSEDVVEVNRPARGDEEKVRGEVERKNEPRDARHPGEEGKRKALCLYTRNSFT